MIPHALLALLGACTSPECPDGTTPDGSGRCYAESEGCPRGYVATEDGNCLWSETTSTVTGTPDTSTPGPTTSGADTGSTDTAAVDTGEATPTSSSTSSTSSTSTPVTGPGAATWVGLRRFEFLITGLQTAAPGQWADGSQRPVSMTIVFADDAYLSSGFDPRKGFHCEITLVSTEPAWPVLGSWVAEGGARVGYEMAEDATVRSDTCAGRIHEAYAHYLTTLQGTTLGVGLHTMTPKEHKALAATIPEWKIIRSWAIGSGWHIGTLKATGTEAAYSAGGYAVGHEVDEYETVLLDGADQPMPRPREASLPAGELPMPGWYEGEVFVFWPIDAVL